MYSGFVFDSIFSDFEMLSRCPEVPRGYGTTNTGDGTTNADAGVGIGMERGMRKNEKTINLADKAIN